MIGTTFLIRVLMATFYILIGLGVSAVFLLVLTKGIRLFVTHFLAPLFGTELELWGRFFTKIGRGITRPFRRKGKRNEDDYSEDREENVL